MRKLFRSRSFHFLLICVSALFYTWLPLLLKHVKEDSFELKALAVGVYVFFVLLCNSVTWLSMHYHYLDLKRHDSDED